MKRCNMKFQFIAFLSLIILFSCKIKQTKLDDQNVSTTHYNDLSEEFLQNLKEGKSTLSIQEELANATIEEIDNALVDDTQRYAFWINIYNAYILAILQENPEAYEDRKTFFKKEQIHIAGEMVSFSKIEHGIIRKSQWELGLGYIGKVFPSGFERKLRVDKRDYRVHFALNCGAKDCPPVAIYTPERLKEQFKKGTKLYLEKSTTYDKETKDAIVTSLFSWFRGDFGGKSGVKKILKENEIIQSTDEVKVSYKSYDWALDLNNFVNL